MMQVARGVSFGLLAFRLMRPKEISVDRGASS